MGSKKQGQRPTISERTTIAVWAAAAGRCTFCNRVVLENDDLGEIVPIGDLAHNVGWSSNSPRGDSDLTDSERSVATNLLLLCRNCHKPVDEKGVIGRYTVEILQRLKVDHESRIRALTAIGADRHALVVRVVGPIRAASPELSYETVLEATTVAGYFPQLLPSAYRHSVELDLRDAGEDTPDAFAASARRIDALTRRIHDGVARDGVQRLAVFGFARIPLLIHLGARLDDKVPTLIFQRQRVNDPNAWRWPEVSGPPPCFTVSAVQRRAGAQRPILILNLSGTIPLADLPPEMEECGPLYIVEPAAPVVPGPTIIDSPAALASLEQALRALFATIERDHGRLASLPVFGALPVSAALTLGRVLMPNVSPALLVFDRESTGAFFLALEVTT